MTVDRVVVIVAVLDLVGVRVEVRDTVTDAVGVRVDGVAVGVSHTKGT